MRKQIRVLRLFVMVLLVGVGWTVLGLLLSVPLGAIFGWSGHPAVPAAPWGVYLALYAGVLPAFCLFVAWKATARIGARDRSSSAG